jgi:hypothetical protein
MLLIIIFLKPIIWLYIECCTSKGNGTFVAYKEIRKKCFLGHLQGLKFQKLRILTLVHLHPASGNDPNH